MLCDKSTFRRVNVLRRIDRYTRALNHHTTPHSTEDIRDIFCLYVHYTHTHIHRRGQFFFVIRCATTNFLTLFAQTHTLFFSEIALDSHTPRHNGHNKTHSLQIESHTASEKYHQYFVWFDGIDMAFNSAHNIDIG